MLRAVAMVLASLVLTGCPGGYEADEYACANADGYFPGDRLADWKGYADHVALVRVQSGRDEGRGPVPDPVLELEVRDVFFSGTGAPALPDTVDVHTPAYMLDGHEYVTPLVYLDADEAWVAQSCSAPVPITDGEVAGSPHPGKGYRPLRDVLAGRATDDFGPLLDRARALPEVRPYLDLRPLARARRVYG